MSSIQDFAKIISCFSSKEYLLVTLAECLHPLHVSYPHLSFLFFVQTISKMQKDLVEIQFRKFWLIIIKSSHLSQSFCSSVIVSCSWSFCRSCWFYSICRRSLNCWLCRLKVFPANLLLHIPSYIYSYPQVAHIFASSYAQLCYSV